MSTIAQRTFTQAMAGVGVNVSVYLVINRTNRKCYVGKTGQRVSARWRQHLWDARKRPQVYFSRAILKYGPGSWEVLEIERAENHEVANALEMKWIALLKSHDPAFGYNSTFGGEGDLATPETKRKIGNVHRGKTITPEHRRRISERMMGNQHRAGKTLSLEQRQKISERHRGKTLSLETRAKISSGLRGRIVSAETRNKLRESALGNKRCLGKVISPEARLKMSDAKRGERSPWYRRDILATDVSELRKAGWSFRSIAVQLGASSSLIRSRVHGRAEG